MYNGSHSCCVLPPIQPPTIPSPHPPVSSKPKSQGKVSPTAILRRSHLLHSFLPLPSQAPSRKALRPSRKSCPPGDGGSGVKLSVREERFTAPHICCSSCRGGPAAPPWWPSRTLLARRPWSWRNTPCSRRRRSERPCPGLPPTSPAPVGRKRKPTLFCILSPEMFPDGGYNSQKQLL